MATTTLSRPVMRREVYSSPYPPSEVWTTRPSAYRYKLESLTRSAATKRKRPSPLILNPTSWSVYSSGWTAELAPDLYRSVNDPGHFVETQYGITDSITPNPINRLASEPSDNTILLNKAVADIKGAGVNLANMLGEYKQAANMFASLSVDVARITLAVLQRNPKLLRPRSTWSKTMAKRHLEYVYGVSPFVQDMHGALAALRKRCSQTYPALLPVTHRKSVFFQGVGKTNTLDYYGKEITRLDRCTRLTKLKGVYALRNTELLAGLGSYGFTNPLATAYELTPFSFVVDWWLNVGEVLDSLDATLFVNPVGSVGTISTLSYGQSVYSGNKSTATALYRNYERVVVSMPTMASLRYKPSPSVQHIANGIALFTTGAFTKFNPLPWRRT